MIPKGNAGAAGAAIAAGGNALDAYDTFLQRGMLGAAHRSLRGPDAVAFMHGQAIYPIDARNALRDTVNQQQDNRKRAEAFAVHLKANLDGILLNAFQDRLQNIDAESANFNSVCNSAIGTYLQSYGHALYPINSFEGRKMLQYLEGEVEAGSDAAALHQRLVEIAGDAEKADLAQAIVIACPVAEASDVLEDYLYNDAALSMSSLGGAKHIFSVFGSVYIKAATFDKKMSMDSRVVARMLGGTSLMGAVEGEQKAMANPKYKGSAPTPVTDILKELFSRKDGKAATVATIKRKLSKAAKARKRKVSDEEVAGALVDSAAGSVRAYTLYAAYTTQVIMGKFGRRTKVEGFRRLLERASEAFPPNSDPRRLIASSIESWEDVAADARQKFIDDVYKTNEDKLKRFTTNQFGTQAEADANGMMQSGYTTAARSQSTGAGRGVIMSRVKRGKPTDYFRTVPETRLGKPGDAMSAAKLAARTTGDQAVMMASLQDRSMKQKKIRDAVAGAMPDQVIAQSRGGPNVITGSGMRQLDSLKHTNPTVYNQLQQMYK